jgi:PKD repeat protein
VQVKRLAPTTAADDSSEPDEEENTNVWRPHIDAEPESGGAPLTVSFVVDADGAQPGVRYLWDFGDGTASVSGRRVQHTFWHPDEYTVTVTAKGVESEESDDVMITVEEEGFDLDIEADPDIGNAPLTVALAAVLDEDLEGPMTFRWEFGDGGRDSSSPTTHTYRAPGEYVAVLTVTNPQGQWAQRDIHIQVDEPEVEE